MKKGERIIIHTPGGGGWGKLGQDKEVRERKDPRAAWKGGSYANLLYFQNAKWYSVIRYFHGNAFSKNHLVNNPPLLS
ncbi:hypothetical protein EYC84_001634 [Monilinia fructicola]|uniref:Hydantoinase B/oxoprolinase domain-containing protein n=1 Tax=Monilinia fructicola TaxID=38448 RepID=A0A5M9JQU7_MONFR|nr:hypothetical protein EYC84_001634 [Monilinia fructicola]